MGRKKGRKKKRSRAKRGSFNIKKLFFILIPLVILTYVIYSLVIFFGVKARDPLSESISSHKFLSRANGDLKKTVFVMERGEGGESAISDIYVLLENASKENSIVLYIPGVVYFTGLEGEFGRPIPISSLRYAGDFLQEGRGVEYTLWQLNEILGFRANDYIWITKDAYGSLNNIYGDMSEIKDKYKEGYVVDQGIAVTDSFLKLHSMSSRHSFLKTLFNPSKVRTLDSNIYSNLSFLNVLSKINSFEKTVNNTTTYVMDLSTGKYATTELSDEGGPITIMNLSEYDKALRRQYIDIIDRELEGERVRIEVYNGSDRVGGAGIYARKILNNGCDVVRFGNAPEVMEKTKVYVSDEVEFSNSLRVVEDVLFGKVERLEERPSFMTTGDIVILLGEDISQLEIF
jgi:hypothetical protein